MPIPTAEDIQIMKNLGAARTTLTVTWAENFIYLTVKKHS